MKICFYGYTLATAATGTATYIYTIANMLSKRGHDVTIVSKGEIDRNLVNNQIRFVSLMPEGKQSRFLVLLFFIKSVFYFLSNRDYNIIHITSGYHDFAPMGYIVKLISRIPVVYSVLTDTDKVWWYKKLNLLLCVNENTVKRIGSNAVYFPTPIEHKERNTDVSFSSKDFINIGAMGTTSYRKGIGILADSIEHIVKVNPNVHFSLAIDFIQNGVKDQKWQELELKRIKNVLSKDSIKDYVTILGKVNIPDFLDSLDVLIYPIQSTDGMNDIPPTLLEGMEHSLCVVISDIGSISNTVKDGFNAVLLTKDEYSDSKMLAHKLVRILSDKDLILRIKNNANPSLNPYSVESKYDYLMNLYGNLIN